MLRGLRAANRVARWRSGASASVQPMATEPPAGGQLRDVRTADQFRLYARNRLIESRLTPNAISLTGFALNVVAAVLVTQRLFFRARAEALGVECKVGIATRPVRVVVLSAGLVFAKGASLGDFELLAPAIYVLAGLTAITVGQRVWHV